MLLSIFSFPSVFSEENNQIHSKINIDWISSNPIISSLKNLVFGGGSNNNKPTPVDNDTPLSLPQLYEKVKNSIVVVNTDMINSSNNEIDHLLGSGFVYDSQAGDIVTVDHVVSGAQNVTVTLADGSTVPAVVLGTDTFSDLALLHVDPQVLIQKNITSLSIDASSLKVGQNVISIGNPLGYSEMMTQGIVSKVNISLPKFDTTTNHIVGYLNVFAINAEITHGNSGGPIFNENGKVIGVAEGIDPEASFINFAISGKTVISVINELESSFRSTHSWLGIEGVDLHLLATHFGFTPGSTGCIITSVTTGSPAGQAGLGNGTDSNRIILSGNYDSKINSDADVILGINYKNDTLIPTDCTGLMKVVDEGFFNSSLSLKVSHNSYIRNVNITPKYYFFNQDNFRTYNNPTYGISLEYPFNWFLQESPKDNGRVIASFYHYINPNQVSDMRVNVGIDPHPSSLNLTNYLNKEIYFYKNSKSFPNFHLNSSSSTDLLDGQNAYYLKFTDRYPEIGLNETHEEKGIVVGSQVYFISTEGDKSTYDILYGPLIKNIINSFYTYKPVFITPIKRLPYMLESPPLLHNRNPEDRMNIIQHKIVINSPPKQTITNTEGNSKKGIITERNNNINTDPLEMLKNLFNNFKRETNRSGTEGTNTQQINPLIIPGINSMHHLGIDKELIKHEDNSHKHSKHNKKHKHR